MTHTNVYYFLTITQNTKYCTTQMLSCQPCLTAKENYIQNCFFKNRFYETLLFSNTGKKQTKRWWQDWVLICFNVIVLFCWKQYKATREKKKLKGMGLAQNDARYLKHWVDKVPSSNVMFSIHCTQLKNCFCSLERPHSHSWNTIDSHLFMSFFGCVSL